MSGIKTAAQHPKLPKHMRAEKKFSSTSADAMARYEEKIRRRGERKLKRKRK